MKNTIKNNIESNVLNNAVFTYLACNHESERFSNHLSIFNGEIIVNYTSKTNLECHHGSVSEIVLIGYCVDSHKELSKKDIIFFLANHEFKSAYNVFNWCKRLSGKYLILYKSKEFFVGISDACGYMKLFYDKKTHCFSSNDKIIADELGLSYSDKSVSIKTNANLSESLPYNLSMYDDVLALMPNHILDMNEFTQKRVPINCICLRKKKDIDNCMDYLISLIKNNIVLFNEDYSFACPLTAGYDSRVILSFLLPVKSDIKCFTYCHRGFSDNTPDLYIPKQICNDLNVPYYQIADMVCDFDTLKQYEEIIGHYTYKNTLDMIHTFKTRFPRCSIMESSIIDHIGKIPFGKNLPDFFASATYLGILSNNFSNLANEEFKKMKKDFKDANETTSPFDLFNMEQRCGKWAALTHTIYSLCGLNLLNPFNCGEIIECMMKIPRKFRKNYIIHNKIFETVNKNMLKYDFNPGESFKILKNNEYIMYFYSILKYTLIKAKHKNK